jgi:NAD(P)-dependent dehydrogenase (short-subunit alcohol dehydrogenase family)
VGRAAVQTESGAPPRSAAGGGFAHRPAGAVPLSHSQLDVFGNVPHYKAAIVGFTRALAKEVGPKGIRVNAVAPGQIATQFHDRFSTPEGRANTVKTIPLGREGEADEIAGAVVYLASPAASFVSGEVIGVNGAMWFH